jgi:hypothetical protein
VRWSVGLLVLSCSTLAHADDPRDVFGLGKKQPAPATGNPREDVFGLGKGKPKQTVDCSDGTAFGCITATDPLADAARPYALAQWLDAKYLLSLPVADATHDAVAHYALGAFPDGAGPSFGGATGLENRWLVQGAPADDVQAGGADTRIPLTFLSGMWVTAGGFTARDRTSTGGMIDAQLVGGTKTHQLDARAWFGWTAHARQRAIVPNTFYVRRGEVNPGLDATASVVATGPLARAGELLGGTAWYALGVAPTIATTTFTWTSQTARDADQDGLYDGYPGLVATEPIDRFSRTPLTWRLPVLARAGVDRGVHHLDLSVVGDVHTANFYFFNATLQAAGTDATTATGDAIATWRGTWTDTHARAQLAWHRMMSREHAHDPAGADVPQLLSAYVPASLPEDPAVAAACADDVIGDKYPKLINCPVPVDWFRSGGAGELTDATGDRPSLTADIAHRIGKSVVRAGATGEDTRLVYDSHFTGGTLIRSLFPEHQSQRRFADPDQPCSTDVALPCPTVDVSELRYRTRYTAAYLEDTWQPTPDIAVDGGLRWELMWVGTVLHFSNELAPRLGMSWDPLGKGRSRVWTSMGRGFAMLPAGLGPTIIRGEKIVDRVISPAGEGRSVQTGAPVPVASGVEPITQDELTAGAQVALELAVRVTTWFQGRWLRRGLETVDGTFDNPGRNGDTQAIRETGIFAAEIATAPTARTELRAGYMYGRSIGTWTGAFNPREGAALYAGSDFNTPPRNLLGRLPDDIGHRVYIEAERSGHVGSAKLAVAVRLTAGSGRPRSVLGYSDEGFIYLLPRGSAGRGPVVTQANVRVSTEARGFVITLDLFNVFNRREAVATNETYSEGVIRPIDGGTLSDLVFLKNEDGSNAMRRPGYGFASAFQSPISVVLGVQRSF